MNPRLVVEQLRQINQRRRGAGQLELRIVIDRSGGVEVECKATGGLPGDELPSHGAKLAGYFLDAEFHVDAALVDEALVEPIRRTGTWLGAPDQVGMLTPYDRAKRA